MKLCEVKEIIFTFRLSDVISELKNLCTLKMMKFYINQRNKARNFCSSFLTSDGFGPQRTTVGREITEARVSRRRMISRNIPDNNDVWGAIMCTTGPVWDAYCSRTNRIFGCLDCVPRLQQNVDGPVD